MTNVNCLKIWDPKMLFLVAELINKMIEQYQTTGVKYHFHPVSLISIKHLIHQHTTASNHCSPKQNMIKIWESIRFSNVMKLMNKIEKQYSNINSCLKYGFQITFFTQSKCWKLAIFKHMFVRIKIIDCSQSEIRIMSEKL